MDFPVYRKYKIGTSYFKINSYSEFEELQKIGNSFAKHIIKANNYYEKLRILDMLECKNSIWVEITEEDFQRVNSKF